MPEFVKQIFIGLATFLLSVFLPKHFVTLVRELTKFLFTSLFKYWYLTLLIVGIFFFFNFKTHYVYLGQFMSYKFVLTLFIALVIIIPTIALLRELFKKYEPTNIAFYGCFSVKENEYLTIDIDSENLNEKIEILTEKITSTFFTYRTKLIKTNNIIIPKFIPILIGKKNLNRFIKKRVNSKKHLATLHFIRGINKQSVSAVINYDKGNLANTNPLSNVERLINDLSTDIDLNSLKIIELSVKIYLLLFGQSLIDLMIHDRDYKNAHYVLDDTEKLITDIKNDAANFPATHKILVDGFINFWTSYVERYKAILLTEQKQFTGAVQHIVKSIKLNPYFPYDSYIDLKQDFTKKYGIALTPYLNEANKRLETNIDGQANDALKAELMKQIQYAETTFNYDIIKHILQKDNSEEIGEFLIRELDKLDKSNPFLLLTKSEVIRYIKKGTEKFNEIYVDRFDECISLLREILKLDSEFPLINTKLGTMIMLKGVHFDNKELIDEGVEEFKKGMHFMLELGFKH